MALMLNIVQFAWWSVKRNKKNKSHCLKFGSVYLLLVATVLVLVQPTCMLVISSWNIDNFFFDGGDMGSFCMGPDSCAADSCSSTNKFECDTTRGVCDYVTCDNLTRAEAEALACGCDMDSNALYPNTTIGVIIQIFGTYLGFIVMFIGVFWATDLHKKLAKKWRKLRGHDGPTTAIIYTDQNGTALAPTAKLEAGPVHVGTVAQSDGDCPDGD